MWNACSALVIIRSNDVMPANRLVEAQRRTANELTQEKEMNTKAMSMLAALVIGAVCLHAQTRQPATGSAATPKASPTQTQQPQGTDNTRMNERDRNSAEPTADSQAETPADRELAAAIRKSITDDKSLSTYARNIKVISQDGTVTLKGPVRSEAEKKSVEERARKVAGTAKVQSELTVEPDQK